FNPARCLGLMIAKERDAIPLHALASRALRNHIQWAGVSRCPAVEVAAGRTPLHVL
ncbi:hypothetical protein LTR95_017223, partial [Oleoguttula sp. CCFEE 5521]